MGSVVVCTIVITVLLIGSIRLSAVFELMKNNRVTGMCLLSRKFHKG